MLRPRLIEWRTRDRRWLLVLGPCLWRVHRPGGLVRPALEVWPCGPVSLWRLTYDATWQGAR